MLVAVRIVTAGVEISIQRRRILARRVSLVGRQLLHTAIGRKRRRLRRYFERAIVSVLAADISRWRRIARLGGE